MTLAMNSTVISGTPRTELDEDDADSILTIGIFERRPSASTMPSGSDTTMPTKDSDSVTSRPPQRAVSTCGRPNTPPTSRKNATIGKPMKSRCVQALARHRGISIGTSSATKQDGNQIGRQRSSIG